MARALNPGPGCGYGWSTTREPERWYQGFQLLLNVEQRPHPENRVVLARDKDPLGTPKAEWRWRAEDQDRLRQVRECVARGLRAADVGTIEIDGDPLPDPNAHHHAGTTRMHPDARLGVVDADGRVHGTENLFATGASVFPTAGFANPTLTIVALAIRLADHVKAWGLF